MRIALRQSWEPIVASGATVVLGVLCLLLSDLGSNRGLGPISAVSVTLAVLAALTFLPAALVLLGRAAFWPFRPGTAAEPEARPRLAAGRRGSSAAVRGGCSFWSVAALIAAAVFAPTYDADGIPISDAIQGESNGVDGQAGARPALRRRLGQPDDHHHARGELAGRSPRRPRRPTASPPSSRSPAARRCPSSSRSSSTGWSGWTRPWTSRPTAPRPSTPSRRCGTTLDDADPEAIVGGETASNLDTRDSAARDLRVIVPSVLARHPARAGAAAALARRPGPAGGDGGAQRRRDGRRGRAAVRQRLRLPRQRPRPSC